MKHIDCIIIPLPLWPLFPKNNLDPNSHIRHPSHSVHSDRALRCRRSNYSRHGPQIPWRSPLVCRAAWCHDIKMDGPLLYPRICNCGPRVVSRLSRLDPDSYQCGICPRRHVSRLATYQTRGFLLAVCSTPFRNQYTSFPNETPRASLACFVLFGCTLALLSQISNPDTPAALYLLSVFVNGLSMGAALNYTLAHLLHLTPPSTHFMSTSLLTTFRGFAGSFGSAIGGGLFVRVLKANLEEGFEQHGGLEGREDLVRRLLGSPALVKSLEGAERAVAVSGYVVAVKSLFVAGAGLVVIMVFVQAGTGWKAGLEKKVESEENVVGNGRGVEDEEWEEGMEQGV